MGRASDDRTRQLVGGALAAGAVAAAGKAVASRLGGQNDEGSAGPSGTYRLKREEDPRDGVRRVAAGRADSALDHLRGKGAPDIAEAVHEARKDLKKLRAVLRLVRDDIGDDVYRRENDRFRDAGRSLANARDAEVKLETLAALAERFGDELRAGALSALRPALEGDRSIATAELEREDDGSRVKATSEIEAGRAAIDDWPLSAGGWELVGPGVRRSYSRGRRRFADVEADPNAENVHEWRKRVKDLWYHLRLLTEAWPSVLGETAEQAHELSDRLGDHHDLAVLAEDVRGRDGALAAEDRDRLFGLIERRQAELLEDALSLGARIYVERPKRFEVRLKAYWSQWRKSS